MIPQIRLITISIDNVLVIYDVSNDYQPLKSFSLVSSPTSNANISHSYHVVNFIATSVSCDARYLSISTGNIASLVVIDIIELTTVFKASNINSYSNASHQSVNSGTASINLSKSSHSIVGIDSMDTKSRYRNNLKNLEISKLVDNNVAVKSLNFASDKIHGNMLYVLLEKHVLILPIPNIVNNSARSRDFPILKRLDFAGTPSQLIFDVGSDLSLVTVMNSSIKESKKNFTLISMKLRNVKTSVLSDPILSSSFDNSMIDYNPNNGMEMDINTTTTKLQINWCNKIYEDHTGSVNDAMVSLPHGKVITVDDSGSICVWTIKAEKLKSFLLNNSNPVKGNNGSSSTSSSPTDDANSIHTENTTMKYNIESNESTKYDSKGEYPHPHENLDYANQQEPNKVEVRESNSEHKISFNNNKSTDNYLDDFEVAVNKDPSMWSAATVASSSTPIKIVERDFYDEVDNFGENIIDEETEEMKNEYMIRPVSISGHAARLEDMFNDDIDTEITLSGNHLTPSLDPSIMISESKEYQKYLGSQERDLLRQLNYEQMDGNSSNLSLQANELIRQYQQIGFDESVSPETPISKYTMADQDNSPSIDASVLGQNQFSSGQETQWIFESEMDEDIQAEFHSHNQTDQDQIKTYKEADSIDQLAPKIVTDFDKDIVEDMNSSILAKGLFVKGTSIKNKGGASLGNSEHFDKNICPKIDGIHTIYS